VSANQRWTLAGVGAPGSGPTFLIDAVHPDDRERAAAAFRRAVARRDSLEIDARLKTADGTYRWSVCHAVPRYRADGSLQGYLGVCWDASATHRAEAALSNVAGKLVAAQETERARIARELHDDLGQQVAVLASKLDALEHRRRVPSSELRATLGRARTGLQEIASSVHTLSHQLHPAKLRLLGLVQTMEGLCRDESSGTGVHVRFRARGVPARLPEDVTLCLFRVAQEALRNALTHSGARAIEVQLTGTPASLTLQVIDNGTGFDPLGPKGAGLGLLTMRERVEIVGGTLTVRPARVGGTMIRVEVPLTARPGAASPSYRLQTSAPVVTSAAHDGIR
jgi:signal transduction histidine kinase